MDKPQAASQLVKEIFSTVERLERFPDSGYVPSELPNSIYRGLYVRPCRIFYRCEGNTVFIIHVMREARHLRQFLLDGETDG
ncbi:type II toxin-antitoxin system RelE/ParE family toxin [Geoalkalibacter halelectricus]|uniref:type II toxin-antitoxin system RelE/ParE family toxin n=1 Tax=Geoalkalibacter halelectricus TaxID=2847045 RepID=UPI003D1F7FDC